jgi:hypothetical protein
MCCLIEESLINKEESIALFDEVTQLVRLFSTIKRKIKEKIDRLSGKKV